MANGNGKLILEPKEKGNYPYSDLPENHLLMNKNALQHTI